MVMGTKMYSKKTANTLIEWIRQYATLHIDSYLADEQRSFPPHVFLDLGNQGFFGMHVSRKYGGLELNTSDMLRVIEQVAAIDLTLTTIIIECIQGAHTLEKYASECMKNRYLNQLATGRIFTAGAMTESAAGSNPRAMKSTATPNNNEDGWLLRGSKRWVGMGATAEVIAIYVQQFDSNNNWLGMSGYLVPKGTEGLRIGPESPTMGLRGFAKNTIYMDNIKVSSDHLLGKSGGGMEIAQDNMMYIRLCLAAASVGAMKRCVQLMLRFAERRSIATGQLIENPVTLIRLSEMTVVIDAIDNFIYLMSSIYDTEPSLVPEEAFVASKILGSEYLGWMVDLLVQTLGARGYEEASGASKLYRDARVFRIFEGPTEALNMYLGSRVLTKNLNLEHFISKTLNQKKLFDEIKFAVDAVNEYCLSNKHELFDKPFAVNYWAQALVGDIISYGLLLAGLEFSLLKNQSAPLQRASLWVRSKYNDIVQKALRFSSAEKTLIHSTQIQEAVSNYTDTIGNVEQSRRSQDIFIDSLLKTNQEQDIHESTTYTEHELHIEHDLCSTRDSENEAYDDQTLVITEEERQQLLHEWNNVEKEHVVSNVCVHQLFEAHVIQNPHTTAVVYQDKKISYVELNTQANKVAHYLKHEGVEKDTLVAIYVERSIEMIVGLLGIFKAGGAYLPLDYNYPNKILNFMFKDSGADIVISQKKFSNNMPFKAKKVIFLEDILASPSPDSNENYKDNVTPNNLGYVIYTSGSSGQPKGVMLPHKALLNLIKWHQGKIREKRNVLQFTTLNFDMSFLEIFSALCSGGILTLISEHDRMDLTSFATIVKKHHVQQLVISVPFLKSLADAKIEKKYFQNLKEIIIAGEQIIITPALLAFFNQLNSCKLLNYYGPSETHVVTGYEFPEKTADWPDHPPIGRAISNTKILILDDEMQLVPIGVSGEIYIGGVSLAKGYINRNDLTQEKFVLDPWGDKPNDRLYRTGDFGKYQSDGNILFLGRKDEQVKIRGFRIEPQEIELHIMKYPGVKEVIVIAKNDIHMHKHLEAYLVIENTEEDHFIEHIYSYLQDRLPAHMIPSAFNVIDEMPLTSSGKINRKALEKYGRSASCSTRKIIQPNTDTEKAIVKIMEDIFKLRIGVNNSYTSVGGNSLLAMHIVSQLQDKFSVQIPAFSILSDPTIADTAKRIDLLISQNGGPEEPLGG